jgi:hypothetical protein
MRSGDLLIVAGRVTKSYLKSLGRSEGFLGLVRSPNINHRGYSDADYAVYLILSHS